MRNSRYVTLKDVALEAGTTAATVSYVLSGKEGRYISQEMRDRVMAAVSATGYIKSSPASSLHGKRQGIIAVLVPQFSNQYFTKLMLAIESVVEKKGYSLSISNTFDDPQRERDLVVKMAQQRVDGFILIPTTDGARSTEPIRKVNLPLVLVDRPLQGAAGQFSEIVPDNYGAGFLLGEHLAQQGHRHVAYLGWEAGFDILDGRRRGFWDGLASVHGPTGREISVAGDFSVESGYKMAERVHREHPEVTAWGIGFNVPGRGVVDYLRDRGIRAGIDLSVALIGAPDWAVVGQNNYTVVDLNPEALGRAAAEALLSELDESLSTPATLTAECRLIPGTSVKSLHDHE